MTTAIEFQDMNRTFGRTAALDSVDLSIPEDSICGLLGRNGSGKTTLMSIIAGQDRPSTGTVTVFGQRPFENETTLSKIMFVRDNQAYPDGYRLRHVLRIAGDFAPNWNPQIAAELVDRLRIPERTPIRKFSRGQFSSVAIVLGLASRAPVTLLDEPYLGLDVTARSVFHEVLLRDYTHHPRTIVLSTHLIEESEGLFDRVVIVDRGRVRVDRERDGIADLAFTMSGPVDVVDRFSTERTILHTHSVSGLKSVTVEGASDEGTAAAAEAAGVRIAPVTLPQLVAAYGAER